MGMYDTLNGEQVKCFPWFSFYVSAMDTKGVVTSHGGDLKYYGCLLYTSPSPRDCD